MFPHAYNVERQQGPVSFTINTVQPEEVDEITQFFLTHFCGKSPILELCQYDRFSTESERAVWMRNVVGGCISKPYSLAARDASSGQLAAVLVNTVIERPSAAQPAPKRENLMHATIEQLNVDIDLFSLLEADKIFYIILAAASIDYARLGLAKKLCELSMDLATSEGVKAIRIETAGNFTYKIASQLGFTLFNSFNFASLELNGEKFLTDVDMGVHDTARLFARRLP